eukprot:15367123-Ditylum_brightwellii.AAC.1
MEKSYGMLEQEHAKFPSRVVSGNEDQLGHEEENFTVSEEGSLMLPRVNHQGCSSPGLGVLISCKIYTLNSDMKARNPVLEENIFDFMTDHPPPTHIISQEEEESMVALSDQVALMRWHYRMQHLPLKNEMTSFKQHIAQEAVPSKAPQVFILCLHLYDQNTLESKRFLEQEKYQASQQASTM